MKIKNLLALLATTLVLGACGGGSDDAAVQEPLAAPTFPVAQALATYAQTPSTQSFIVSGTLTVAGDDGTTTVLAVTGSGTDTQSAPTAAVFNASNVQAVTRTTVGQGTVLGMSFPFGGDRSTYFDASFKPVGFATGPIFSIMATNTPEVTSAQVGGSGTLYSYNVYAAALPNQLVGSGTVTYALEADTDSTALLKLTEILRDTTGAVMSNTLQTYRIGTNGSLQLLTEQGLDVDFDLTFTFSPAPSPSPAIE